jgi:surfactin synthase thioesterase subunit
MVYKKWAQYLGPLIDLRPVELAGRGSRANETPCDSIEMLVDDVFDTIRAELLQSPYALFGHSLGACIVHDLAQRIQKSDLRRPEHLFFSGRYAPHLRRPDEKKYHLMENEEFKREVIGLGGTPPEFFEYPELLEFFIPVLKKDFQISETIEPVSTISPFPVDITVFLGKDDDQTPEQCDGWKMYTNRICSIHYFDGGHFFINEHARSVARIISGTLKDRSEELVTIPKTVL